MHINTMVEMDSFRHGQAQQAGNITDNRIKCSNGLDEASITASTRRSTATATPPTAARPATATSASTGTRRRCILARLGWRHRPDRRGLDAETVGRCTITGGKPTLGITNVFGFKAIAIALDAQRRDINLKKHDLEWVAFSYNGVEIYPDPLAPSAVAQNYIPLGPAQGGAQGNTNLVDGVGSEHADHLVYHSAVCERVGSTVELLADRIWPAVELTTIQPSEALYFLEPESFKIRPTNKPGFRFGIRRVPQQNNVSVDGIMMRLGINLYNTQVRHNNYAFGFSA